MTSIRAKIAAEDRLHLLALAALCMIAVLLRLLFINQPMRDDETQTYMDFASKPLAVALSDYRDPNNHLFHTFLVHISTRLLGNAPWMIRLPAFFAGVLLVPALYVTARRLFNREVGLCAAALIAVSSVAVEFSTNARGYTLVSLFFVLLLTFSTYLIEQRRTAMWVAFGALAVLGCYTTPSMLLPLGIVVVWLGLSILLTQTGRARWLALRDLVVTLVGVGVVTLILYLPVFAASGVAAVTSNRAVVPRPWDVFFTRLPNTFLQIWYRWHRDVPKILEWAMIAGFGVGLLLHGRIARYRVPLVLVAVAWLTPVVVIQRLTPSPRVWLFLLPIYLMTVSAGIVLIVGWVMRRAHRLLPDGAALARWITPQRLTMLVVLALALLLSFNLYRSRSVYFSRETGRFHDAEGAVTFTEPLLTPTDRVLCKSGSTYQILQYYFMRQDIPPDFLTTTNADAARYFVVVNTEGGDVTVDLVLDQAGIDPAAYEPPQLVWEHDYGQVYELRRKS